MKPSGQRAVRSALWIACLNALPSVFWSALCIAPVYIFCASYMGRSWLYGFGAASLFPHAFPLPWLRHFELSSSPSTYRRFGVPLVNQVAQHGTLIHRFVRHRDPNARHALNAREIVRLQGVSYDQERFHMMGFLFFSFSAGYAIARAKPVWAFVLLLCNIAYNLYPIWLQQYVRMRLRRVGARRQGSAT